MVTTGLQFPGFRISLKFDAVRKIPYESLNQPSKNSEFDLLFISEIK